jgi:hypothetical protein
MATINREFFSAPFREKTNGHIRRIAQQLFQLEEQAGDPKNNLPNMQDSFVVSLSNHEQLNF